MKKCVLVILIFFSAVMRIHASNLGAELELACPCTFSTDSVTSAVINAGVTNIGSTATGVLKIRVLGHDLPNAVDSVGLRILAETPITLSLAAGGEIAATDFKTGLVLPDDGTYFLTFQLLEDDVQVDTWGLEQQVTLLSAGGSSSGVGSFYFDSEPGIAINGTTATLSIPAIVNNSTSDNPTIRLRLFATETAAFFGSTGFNLAEHEFIDSLNAGARTDAVSVDYDIQEQAGFEYLHFDVLDASTDDTLLYQTVRVPNGLTKVTRSFQSNARNYLLDSDDDGVGDVNERLMGTDADSASSLPDASTIDILVVYSSGVAALYGGDPSVRIDHLMAFSNQVLSDSNVDIQMRLAGVTELAMNESQSIDAWLNEADGRTGVFTDLDALRDQYAADLIVLLQPYNGGDTCGLANLGGFTSRGDFSALSNIQLGHTAVYIDSCADNTMLHEIGHLMGLGHSFRQNETGTFDWSRGHGVVNSFTTLMGYESVFNASELPFLSNPQLSVCDGQPCGIDIDQPEAAFSAKSMNIVRFQVANFRAALAADSDGDGSPDDVDAFPNDPAETLDTDMDAVGNNADTDDDNDEIPDTFEIANNLDPLVNDADQDPDGDGATNLEEFLADTDPQVAEVDVCLDPEAVGALAASSALAMETRLLVANPGSNNTQQTFLRFVNTVDSTTNVEIYGIDDSGIASKRGPVSFSLGAQASKQITAAELESGSEAKGLTSRLCDGQGKWQLIVRSDNAVQLLGLIRTPDGFLTGLNDVAPGGGGSRFVYFANPASNSNQQTFLRLVNKSTVSGSVSITGLDDAGQPSSGTAMLNLDANRSQQLTASDLENGNANKGLTGGLGSGTGKWRLDVSSSLDLDVISMIRTPDGFLTNLSGVVPADGNGNPVIYFANPASESVRATFIRIINPTDSVATITISGIDDNGDIAPSGDVSLTLAAQSSKQVLVSDLENGNVNKGLSGMLGDGDGRWRLTFTSNVGLVVMSLVRTPDGFLTNLSRVTPLSSVSTNEVYLFNPGSNTAQRSTLRIINDSASQGAVTISGVDDQGVMAPSGAVTFNIPAMSAMTLSAQDLEQGNGDLGLVGALGDGSGKWHLQVTADVDLKVQNLLDTPTGFLTNLSRPVE